MKALEILLDRIGGKLLASTDVEWRSVTFSGWRTTAVIRFEGDAVIDGEALLSMLGEFDQLGGRKVCEANILWRNCRSAPARRLDAQIELLLLDQAKEAA